MPRCILCCDPLPASRYGATLFEDCPDPDAEVVCGPCQRLCDVCELPTGDRYASFCPACQQAMARIQAAHDAGGDRKKVVADPGREERLRDYERRAALGLALFEDCPVPADEELEPETEDEVYELFR